MVVRVVVLAQHFTHGVTYLAALITPKAPFHRIEVRRNDPQVSLNACK